MSVRLFPTNLLGHYSSFRGPFRILAAGQEVPSANFRGTCVSLFASANLPRGMVYKIRFREHWRRNESILSEVAACVGLGSNGLPMLRGHLPANSGPPFRGASAKLPQTFREVRRLFWPSWLAVGIRSWSKCCVSCTQQHLFFYWNRFSELFRARTETFSCKSAANLPRTNPFREPSARFRACGAAHIFNNNVPLPTKLTCG